MKIHAGSILISSPSLEDDHFHTVVIFVTTHNEQGATGFIINQPYPRALNELVEFRNSPALDLYKGGPVDTEHLYFIHRSPSIQNSKPIVEDIYLGGNFNQAIHLIQQQQITVDNLKLFIGYCGWDAGELEAEIEEGSWWVMDVEPTIAFSNNTTLWNDLKARLG